MQLARSEVGGGGYGKTNVCPPLTEHTVFTISLSPWQGDPTFTPRLQGNNPYEGFNGVRKNGEKMQISDCVYSSSQQRCCQPSVVVGRRMLLMTLSARLRLQHLTVTIITQTVVINHHTCNFRKLLNDTQRRKKTLRFL